MGLDGSIREYELPDSNYYPALSPNRARLAFVRNPGDEIWLGPTRNLEAARQISIEPPFRQTYGYASVFAPDGRSLVYASSLGSGPGPSLWELVRYWPKSGKRAVSTEFRGPHPDPDISPNGRLLAFVYGSTIRLRRFGGTGWQLPTPDPARAPSFSPDGRWLAYLSPAGENWQVFISRLDGSDRRQGRFSSADWTGPTAGR